MNYVNLHTHTSFSDGFGRTDSLVKMAKDLEQEAYAITDHGTISGWLEFMSVCKEQDVKPIFGVEAYVEAEPNKIGHMTLLAENIQGIKSIEKLISLGHHKQKRNNPITINELIDSSDGLFLFTGCPASPLLALLHEPKKLDDIVKRLAAAFNNRLYIEMMPHAHMTDYIDRVAYFVDAYPWLPVVATNDIHYAAPILQSAHMIIRRDISHYKYDNSNLHNRDAERMAQDMWDSYSHRLPSKVITEAINNTLKIAYICQNIEFDAGVHLPYDEDGINVMLAEAASNLKTMKHYAPVSDYAKRFLTEWDVIERKGYKPYFYIVWQLVKFMQRNDIEYSTRGSGAGSLVLNLLEITDIDPIRHDLLFERFLNETRPDWPDVDLDCESVRRNEVLEYAKNRWGATPIPTKQRYSHRLMVRALGRVLDFPKEKTDIASYNDKSPELAELLKLADGNSGIAYEYGMGQIRHTGKHAGGIVISDKWLPQERLADGTLAIPWDDLEPVGGVKFDVLGLRTLSSYKRMKDIIGLSPGPFGEDMSVLETIASGNTLGIFQMSGDGITKLIKAMGIKKGEDIAIALALFRPGPLGSGMAGEYPSLEFSPRLIHPKVDPILAGTRGVIVFQEQMMQVFQAITGLPSVEADILRKIVSKKDINNPKWKTYRDAFITGCTNDLAMTPTAAIDFWEEIASFDLYGFNKSHAMAYAYIAYKMAWCKTHFPYAFYTAQLEYDVHHTLPLMFEAVEQGAQIKPPHVNFSSKMYETNGSDIFMPLNSIYRVGDIASQAIIVEHALNGAFKSLEDFDLRVDRRKVHKGVKLALYAAGAFDGIPGSAINSFGLDAAKVDEINQMERPQRQAHYLQQILPTKKKLDTLRDLADSRKDDVGCVYFFMHKENDNGPYTTVTVKPSGNRYYFNGHIDLIPGEVVSVSGDWKKRTITPIQR